MGGAWGGVPARVAVLDARVVARWRRILCLDRDVKIVVGADVLPWVDMLVEQTPVAYGAVVEVRVVWP
jgi:hypothetical protein